MKKGTVSVPYGKAESSDRNGSCWPKRAGKGGLKGMERGRRVKGSRPSGKGSRSQRKWGISASDLLTTGRKRHQQRWNGAQSAVQQKKGRQRKSHYRHKSRQVVTWEGEKPSSRGEKKDKKGKNHMTPRKKGLKDIWNRGGAFAF